MPIYPGSIPGTVSSKFGTQPDFYNDFGCVCDGVTDDTVTAQTAINTVAVSGRVQYVYIPHGKSMAVSQLSIPSNIIIAGYGPLSKIVFIGSKPTGVGRLDFAGGVSNSGLENLTIVGKAPTSTGIDYATITSPIQASLSDGTSIWVHGASGSGDIHLRKVRITNTEGYAVLLDATTGNISGITIRDCVFYDNRPHTFGVSGSFIYGSWTGGIHYENDGTLYSVDDVLVDSCRFYRMSGHCFWGHGSALTKLNTNIRFNNNYSQDTALDVVEIGVTNGYQVCNNRMSRIGYLSTTNGAPGAPKWGTVSPIGIDHTGTCINGIISGNVMDAVNGGAFDCDGMAYTSIVGNNVTSSWVSADPLADSAHCGSLSNGVNISAGVNLGNSTFALGSPGGDGVSTIGNRFDGFGAGAIRYYAGRNGKISGNTIYHPADATVSPIVIGSLGSASNQRANNNDVSDNSIFWAPASIGAGVAEDGSIALPGSAFVAGDVNIVNGTRGAGNFFEFFKDPLSSSTTGHVQLNSVTASATQSTTVGKLVGTIMKTEGVSLAAHSFKLYRSDDTVILTSTITTTDIVSLTISGNGCISNTRDIIGRSLSIFPVPYTGGGHLYVKHDEVYDGINVQIALNAGTGGTSAPVWNPTVGANTLDNGGGPSGVTWKNLGPPITVSAVRDGYVRSLTIDGFGLVIDDNGNYLGPASLSPPVVIGSTAYTTPGNALTVLTQGAFNNLDECVPIVAMMNTATASMRDLTNFFQPYQVGHLVGSREAVISAGGRNKVGSTNWELDGLRIVMVNDNPAQFNPAFGGFYQGNTVVGASIFGVNLAAPVSGVLGTVFGLNTGLADYDATTGGSNKQSILIHWEADTHVQTSTTVVRGVNMNVSWLGGGSQPSFPDWTAYAIDNAGGYYGYGFISRSGSSVIGLQLEAGASTTNSQPIQFVSGGPPYNSRIFANSSGQIVLAPDIGSVLGPAKQTLVTFHGLNSYAYVLDGAGYTQTNASAVGLIYSNAGDCYANSFTLHSAFANILCIDNTNTATFAQLKMSDGVHTQVAIGPVNSLGYSNTNFSLVTCIGIQVGSNSGISGGAPGGCVNVNSGYMINGALITGSTGVLTTGTLNCTTLNVTSLTFASLTVTGSPSTAGIVLSTGFIQSAEGFYSTTYNPYALNFSNGGAVIGAVTINEYIPVLDIGCKISIKGQTFAGYTGTHFYTPGERIIDSSGFVQICIQSGNTNSSPPSFNHTYGGFTFESFPSTVVWACNGLANGNAYYVARDSTLTCGGYFGVTSGGAFMGTYTSNSFGVRTSNIDRIIITASGLVGINGTPLTGGGFGQTFQVNGSILASGMVSTAGCEATGFNIHGGVTGGSNAIAVSTPGGGFVILKFSNGIFYN